MARNKIGQLIEVSGITRYEIAKKSGLSLRLVYYLASVEEIPPKTNWDTLKRLRDALGLECVDELESDE